MPQIPQKERQAEQNPAWQRNTRPAEPAVKVLREHIALVGEFQRQEGEWEFKLEQAKFFTLVVAKKCEKEAREPHEVEVHILGRKLQELSSHMEEQVAYRRIRTFVEKYSA